MSWNIESNKIQHIETLDGTLYEYSIFNTNPLTFQFSNNMRPQYETFINTTWSIQSIVDSTHPTKDPFLYFQHFADKESHKTKVYNTYENQWYDLTIIVDASEFITSFIVQSCIWNADTNPEIVCTGLQYCKLPTTTNDDMIIQKNCYVHGESYFKDGVTITAPLDVLGRSTFLVQETHKGTEEHTGKVYFANSISVLPKISRTSGAITYGVYNFSVSSNRLILKKNNIEDTAKNIRLIVMNNSSYSIQPLGDAELLGDGVNYYILGIADPNA